MHMNASQLGLFAWEGGVEKGGQCIRVPAALRAPNNSRPECQREWMSNHRTRARRVAH